jgi:hypothetical protein
MKNEFKKYLKSIDITTKALLGRIEKLYDTCLIICPGDYEDIFVDETVDGEGKRIYECLNFHSKKHAISIHDFITKDHVWISARFKDIDYARLTSEKYDFKKADKNSRLYLQYRTPSDIRGDYKASGKNCEALFAYYKKYILPILT